MRSAFAKIDSRSAKIGIMGLGYVGLPLAQAFAEKGFETAGFEIDPKKIAALNRGESTIGDIASEKLSPLVRNKKLSATGDFEKLGAMDAVILCVPTPLRKSREPDLTYVLSAAQAVQKRLRKGQLIVLESTTYPGTTEEMVLPLLSAGGLKAGEDFCLAFSPERIDPGNKTFGIRNTPKVIGGVTPNCLELASALYQTIVETVVPVSGTKVAELVKLLENTFRAVNIGLVNEMAIICNKLGVDTGEVIQAAASKPFGFLPFWPGPGLGGHCIPVDPQYLSWKLRHLNYHPRFIQLADEINTAMPKYVAQRIASALNEKGKPLKGSKILVMGVSYKKDVGDLRESPALDVIEELLKSGAFLSYHDPFVPEIQVGDHRLISQKPRYAGQDCVAILTDHSAFDYETLLRESPLVFDARNATLKKPPASAKVIRI